MNVLITGASGKLGSELVKTFLKRGDRVYGIGRRAGAESLARMAGDANFKYTACDVASWQESGETIKIIMKDFIPDIVLFCAGQAFDDVDARGIKAAKTIENFDVNLFGVLYWIEPLLPVFLKRGRGVFACVSSMSVFKENHARRIGYSASRAALNKLFENLRLEYLGSGVKFIVFNMGRMTDLKAAFGITYVRAARKIAHIVNLESVPNKTYNIPLSQYVATRITALMPDAWYVRFIRK
jgi:NAD(P)-dependent dehydrogenase (short-subunit alcohol dehydrogenase family)